MCADKFIEVSFRSEENERKCIANSLIRRDTHYAFVCVCVCADSNENDDTRILMASFYDRLLFLVWLLIQPAGI